jgi:hypothetical protein
LTISPISTKIITTSHLASYTKKTMTYANGNPGLDFEQTQK